MYSCVRPHKATAVVSTRGGGGQTVHDMEWGEQSQTEKDVGDAILDESKACCLLMDFSESALSSSRETLRFNKSFFITGIHIT